MAKLIRHHPFNVDLSRYTVEALRDLDTDRLMYIHAANTALDAKLPDEDELYKLEAIKEELDKRKHTI